MAEMNHTPLNTITLKLSDEVSDSLNKAMAIVWLMGNQLNEIIDPEASAYASMAARELMAKAMAAVESHREHINAL